VRRGVDVTHPYHVRTVHQAYVDAGAEVLLTNIFQATDSGLKSRGCQISPESVISAGIKLARECGKWVLADLGPYDDEIIWTQQTARWEYSCRYHLAAANECDGLLIETISNDQPVAKVFKQLGPQRFDNQKPILVSATYLRDSEGIRTFTGLTPEEFARQIENYWFVQAVGVNCGRDIGIRECVEIVHRYRDATHLPVFVRPNAGTPKFRNACWVYPHSAQYMASWLPELLQAGVRMIGGCCGTTPEYIAAFKKVIDEWNARIVR